MNKPVAWMDSYGNICLDIDKRMNQGKITARYNYDSCDIPLYTHPIKELTDEEIISSAEEAGFDWSSDKGIFARHSNGSWIGLDVKMVDFAKAILRKAQEK